MRNIILLILILFLICGCSRVTINSSNELSESECQALGGHLESQQGDGTACKSNQIDLGRVNDVRCKCQCCKPESAAIQCNKEENCCTTDKDCEYAWFTGSCNTPEYVAKRQKEAQEQGMHYGEAPPRENVTCTCENSKCITHG
jgi:uncharacterized protein YceK